MKSIILTVFALLLFGCTTATIVQNKPVNFTDKLDVSEVSTAVIAGLKQSTWSIKEIQTDKVLSQRTNGSWSVDIAVFFDTNSYEIKYLKSSGLGFDNKTQTIHSNYNVWIQEVKEKIDYFLSAPEQAQAVADAKGIIFADNSEDQPSQHLKQIYLFKNLNDPLNIGNAIQSSLASNGYRVSMMMPNSPIPIPPTTENVNKSSQSGSGSRFLISEDGYILTNQHVTNGSSDIVVYVDKKPYRAHIIKETSNLDLALIKAEGIHKANHINAFSIGNIELGTELYALGFPLIDTLGVGLRITEGIVSSMGGMHDEGTAFQMTASIHPGNSGGPVVDSEGKLLGVSVSRVNDQYLMTTRGIIGQNLNFAVNGEFISAFLIGTPVKESPDQVTNSLKNSIASTTLIAVNFSNNTRNQSSPPTHQNNTIAIKYNYSSYWDVFVHQMKNLSIEAYDPYTGEIYASVQDGGDSLRGHQGYLDRAIANLIKQLM